jgi:hypothetical protein
MKKAIVTLTIGSAYEKLFTYYSRDNWQTYCDNFDYELIVITNPLDNSERALKRSSSWQKLLILSQEWSCDYDRIVWVDSDIVVNNIHAYDICSNVPAAKVGAVEMYSIPTREIHDIALDRLYKYWKKHNTPYIDNLTPESYYTKRGIPGAGLTEVVQAGVLVCSPKDHRQIFESVYNNYEDTHGPEWNYELPPISYELLKAHMVHWISPRFNFCVYPVMAAFYPDFFSKKNSSITSIVDKLFRRLRIGDQQKAELIYLKNIYDLSIFMHFAGCSNMIPRMSRITTLG